MALNQAPEKGIQSLKSVETNKLIVRQPAKLAELSKLLETFENLNARVGERVGEGSSHDLGGGGFAGSSGQQGDDGVSPRDQAISRMPPPLVIRQRLENHIEQEVAKLERLAKRASASSKPGAAYRLNELYARIRRLNSLLAHLLEAAEEVLKRLFIRVFIDKQPIL